MPRKGENIYKRKDNRWEARVWMGYSLSGKRKYHSIYGSSYKEVKQKRQEYLLLHPKKEKSCSDYFATEVPFEAYIKQWLQLQKNKVKPSTYSTYRRIVDAQLIPELGKFTLKEITPIMIDNFLKSRETNGRCDGQGGLSAKTISDLAILLSSVFDYIYKEYEYTNPMKDFKHPVRKQRTPEALSQEESQILTRYLIKNISFEGLGIMSSLYMGLRLGEVCALRWENIDLEKQVFQIRHTLYRVLNEEKNATSPKTVLMLSTPKTETSLRDVPIPQFMLPLLEKMQASEEKYLLTGTSDYMDPRTYQNHFKYILKGCSLRNVTYHCLRHTFATNCVILDFDIKTLSEILGHTNTTITLNRYVHSSLYRKKLQMKKLSNSVSSIL